MLRAEAVATVNRPACARLERYLGNVAALAACCLEHFAPAAAGASAAGAMRGAAVVATAGLVGKALLGKESLLSCGERKRTSAVAAAQSFIGVH
ncbi:MAG TPA: hypothetical protein VKE42_04190 [Candidatus Cybelea sp.]|nr:hypothetical protein [Candidatus Cybelea sp.]